MHASVRLLLPDGSVETLQDGDLVGRTRVAALRLDDPQVSEAHAMVSLRGERLWMLALRRRFVVDGKATDAVPLTVGLTLRFSPTIELEVVELDLPDAVLGLEGRGMPAQALPGTCALVFDPHPRLVPSAAEPEAHFWVMDGRWRASVGGAAPVDLEPGTPLTIAGQPFRAVPIALRKAGHSHTRAGLDGPLRIVSTFDTVHIHRADGEVIALAGQMARVIAELVSVRQPLAWEELARPNWPQLTDRDALRRRWDGLLVRLRDRLREGGVRTDLVSSTRIGLVELVLRDGDEVVDRA